jgi:hypothetical protein
MNVYSPNLIAGRDGSVLLLFMRQHRAGELTNHVWKSTDNGATFVPYSEFVPRGDFPLCNGTVKRLASGRLLLPGESAWCSVSVPRRVRMRLLCCGVTTTV